jgi:hypothetical protein
MKIIFLVCLFLSSYAYTQEEAGKVARMQGVVKRMNKTLREAVELKVTSNIYPNDIITTEQRSFVKILMQDGTLIQIGPKSSLTIAEFEFENSTAKRKSAAYHMEKGSLRAMFTKGEQRNIKVSSPTVSMGIRGTELMAEVFEKEGKFESEIVLLEGEIELSFRNSDQSIIMNPGQFISTIDQTSKAPSLKEVPQAYASLFQRKAENGGAVFMNDITRQVKYNIKNDINVGGSFKKLKETEKVFLNASEKTSEDMGAGNVIKSFGDLMDLNKELEKEETLTPDVIQHEFINEGLRYDSASQIDTSNSFKHVPTSQMGKSIRANQKVMKGVDKGPSNRHSMPVKPLPPPPPPTGAGTTTMDTTVNTKGGNVDVKEPVKNQPPPPVVSPTLLPKPKNTSN